jgi:hypothetical protein
MVPNLQLNAESTLQGVCFSFCSDVLLSPLKSVPFSGGWFSVFGFPSDFWLPLHQGHTLFNPVEFQLVMRQAPDFLRFLQPCWEGCRSRQHQTAARTEC